MVVDELRHLPGMTEAKQISVSISTLRAKISTKVFANVTQNRHAAKKVLKLMKHAFVIHVRAGYKKSLCGCSSC